MGIGAVSMLLLVLIQVQELDWIAIPYRPPGTTTSELYEVKRDNGFVVVRSYTKPVDTPATWVVSSFVGWRVAESLWCAANGKLDRVVVVARVTNTGSVETVMGSPSWIRSDACPFALMLPVDTVSVHSVVAFYRGPQLPP